MNEDRLPEARIRFPERAADEVDAEQRLRAAVAAGDIQGGAKALADWVDARAGMLVYLDVEDMSRSTN